MGLRILIAEDDALIAMELEAIAEAEGHRVCGCASTGPEAVALARECRPDVVLMDGFLAEGTSGVFAAAVITGALRIPVIMVSAHLDAQTARDAGATALVPKPFRRTDIGRVLRDAGPTG